MLGYLSLISDSGAHAGTKAVDAFTYDWGSETSWFCPPLYLVPRVLRHAQKTMAKGTFIVPIWKSAPFWPMLFSSKDKPAKYVVDMQVMMRSDHLVLPGFNLFKGSPNSDMLALFVDFTGQSDKGAVCQNKSST